MIIDAIDVRSQDQFRRPRVVGLGFTATEALASAAKCRHYAQPRVTPVGDAPARTAPRARGAGRPRARRASTSRDDGEDSSEAEPPTESWRWADPASWRSFVASVDSRDFERELYLERQGVAR